MKKLRLVHITADMIMMESHSLLQGVLPYFTAQQARTMKDMNKTVVTDEAPVAILNPFSRVLKTIV